MLLELLPSKLAFPPQDIFFGTLFVYASWIGIADRAPRCIADHGAAEAAAQQPWWRRRRRSGGGELPFGELGCCFMSPLRSVCFASWLWAIHQQQRGFLQQQHTCYAAAAVMTTVVGGKRTLLPATGTPCRVSRRIHHTASLNVRPVALDAGLPTQSQRTR